MRGQLDELLVFQLVVVDAADLKYTLGQRTGLVEDHDLRLRKRLHVVRALDQHTGLARAADAREEAQRNADDQRTGAGDDQERQRAVDPDRPRGRIARDQIDDRRQNCQRQRRAAHGGGIDPRKFGDERLRPRLAGGRFFDQLQDLRDCRFAEVFRRADLQHAGHVDAAADDLLAGDDLTRQALAGQRAGVETGRALDDDAVDRHLFARLHDDHAADRNRIRVDLLKLAVCFDVGIVRADVHERRDVPAALADRVALEQLADLVEQHNGDGLGEVRVLFVDRQRDRTERGDGHQEVFVEHTAVADALGGLFQDIIADDQIRHGEQHDPHHAGHRDELRDQQQHDRDADPDQHFFLFLRHGEAHPFLLI